MNIGDVVVLRGDKSNNNKYRIVARVSPTKVMAKHIFTDKELVIDTVDLKVSEVNWSRS